MINSYSIDYKGYDNELIAIQVLPKYQFVFMWFIQDKLFPNKGIQNLFALGAILEKVVNSISTKDTF